MLNPTSEKLAWSLKEISELSTLSLGYLRNDVRRGKLPVKKFGRRSLVLTEDLKTYMQQRDRADRAVDQNGHGE